MTTINSLLFLLFCGITCIALLVVLNLLLPGKVERVREKLEGHYIRSFVIGLIALGFSFAILLLLAYLINLPIFKTKLVSENAQYVSLGQMPMPGIFTLLLILLALGLTSISAIGLAALANSLGRRVGKVGPSINPNLLGGSLLVLSGLAPFLGWFIFAPVALCIGFGSTILTLFQRKPTPKVSK
jgi:hypothetical protein